MVMKPTETEKIDKAIEQFAARPHSFASKTTAVPVLDRLRDKGPPVDLGKIAARVIDTPAAYAPPTIRDREEVFIKQIEKFGELPTIELDQIVQAAEEEIADLKRRAQAVRDIYTKHTQQIAADIKRLQEGVKLSIATMNTLREQCVKLDAVREEEETELPPVFLLGKNDGGKS